MEGKIRELTGQIERLEREKTDVTSLLAEVSQTKKELLSLDGAERGTVRR
jgi:prefoldin subunit 5